MPEPQQQQSVDISNPILGRLSISGATLNTIFTVLGFVVACFIGFILWQHHSLAGDDKKEVVKALNDNNAIIVKSLEKQNEAVVRAIDQMTLEHRRGAEVMKEIACLNDPAMKNRNDAREFCKRMSRDYRNGDGR